MLTPPPQSLPDGQAKQEANTLQHNLAFHDLLPRNTLLRGLRQKLARLWRRVRGE